MVGGRQGRHEAVEGEAVGLGELGTPLHMYASGNLADT